MRRAHRTDAGLALCVLCGSLLVLRRVGLRISLPGALGGALGTLAFEYVASRHQERIRRWWTRADVRALTVTGTLALVVGSARGRSGTLLSAICGALLCYLVLLAGVATGRLSHPTEW